MRVKGKGKVQMCRYTATRGAARGWTITIESDDGHVVCEIEIPDEKLGALMGGLPVTGDLTRYVPKAK